MCSSRSIAPRRRARNDGADIIDLGMGNPDLPAPAHVVEKLKETIGKSRTDRYSASKGIPGLRRAQAAYYARRFGVKLNPETQIVTTLGSKEGFANVAQAITCFVTTTYCWPEPCPGHMASVPAMASAKSIIQVSLRLRRLFIEPILRSAFSGTEYFVR